MIALGVAWQAARGAFTLYRRPILIGAGVALAVGVLLIRDAAHVREGREIERRASIEATREAGRKLQEQYNENSRRAGDPDYIDERLRRGSFAVPQSLCGGRATLPSGECVDTRGPAPLDRPDIADQADAISR